MLIYIVTEFINSPLQDLCNKKIKITVTKNIIEKLISGASKFGPEEK